MKLERVKVIVGIKVMKLKRNKMMKFWIMKLERIKMKLVGIKMKFENQARSDTLELIRTKSLV